MEEGLLVLPSGIGVFIRVAASYDDIEPYIQGLQGSELDISPHRKLHPDLRVELNLSDLSHPLGYLEVIACIDAFIAADLHKRIPGKRRVAAESIVECMRIVAQPRKDVRHCEIEPEFQARLERIDSPV